MTLKKISIFQSNTQKIIAVWFVINAILLFFYSFTQVDLNLTLSRFPLLHLFIKSFQYIGFYERHLSTNLYIGILISFYLSYFYFLYQAYKKRISTKLVWSLLFVLVPILVFSYNAFSYDLFNYLFDAKIFTFYNQNPYFQKPLDYPNDPMVHFMRWTHRTYPYGPVWLLLSIPLSYIGLNLFIPTIVLFKFLMAGCFIGTVYYIGKIAKKLTPGDEALSMVFIGLSPLFLIENLVSAHNDIVMLFFAVASFFYLLSKRYILATILLTLSVGIKFATIFVLPAYLLLFYVQTRSKNLSKWWAGITVLAVGLMAIATVIATYRTNFQPWYLLFFLPFAALVLRRVYILIPSLVFMTLSPLVYAPFIYLGSVNPPLPVWLDYLNTIMISVSVVATILYYLLFSGKIIKRGKGNS